MPTVYALDRVIAWTSSRTAPSRSSDGTTRLTRPQSSAYTVATGKRAFYSQIDRAEDEAYERCELVMTENALAHDAQEGMTAFLDKREPVWRGD